MWALLISLFVASVVCAFKLVHTFTDWADRLGAAHITAVAGLSIAFFISALVPVDVANAGGCSLPLTARGPAWKRLTCNTTSCSTQRAARAGFGC